VGLLLYWSVGSFWANDGCEIARNAIKISRIAHLVVMGRFSPRCINFTKLDGSEKTLGAEGLDSVRLDLTPRVPLWREVFSSAAHDEASLGQRPTVSNGSLNTDFRKARKMRLIDT